MIMLYTVTRFLAPRGSEGGVRIEGKSGQDAKDIVEKKYNKKAQAELNAALENALFQDFAEWMRDENFDIDDPADLLDMKILIERTSKEITLSPEKKKQYAEALNLISELRDLYQLQSIEEENNVGQTQEKLMKLKKKTHQFADFNENDNVGNDFKNERKERKFKKKEKEQREIEDIKKDFMDAIYKIDAIDNTEAEIIKWSIEKGELDPDDLEESLAKSYVNATMPEKQAAIADARKGRWKNGKET